MKQKIKYIDKTTIRDYQFPNTPQAEKIKQYFMPFFRNETHNLIENMHVEAALIEINQVVIPLFIAEKNYQDNYTVSFFSQFVTYPLEELRFLKSNLTRKFSWFMLNLFKFYLKSFQINKTIYIYNFGTSTVLHDETSLTEEIILSITHFLTRRFPAHQLAWRSLNTHTEKKLLARLEKAGYKPILSRKVLIAKPIDQLNKKHRKNLHADATYLKKNNFTIKRQTVVNKDESEKIVQLYNQLYIRKYSTQNPQVTPYYLQELGNFYSYNLLFDQDQMIGVLVYYNNQRYVTAPIVGYDFSYPKKQGLYRILTCDFYTETMKTAHGLNWSSGVEVFKKNRGSIAIPEFHYIYYKHLSWYRKTSWRFFCFLVNKIALKILLNNEV